MGILNNLNHFVPLNAKLLIYSALISSYLNFGILAWGYKCDRIVKLQKRIVRIVSISKFNAHTEPIFKTLKLLKVKDILKLQELKFYYKYEHNKLPYYLAKLPLNMNTSIHNYETRTQHKIHMSKPNNEYAKICIRYDISTIVNNTPNNIIEKNTYTQPTRLFCLYKTTLHTDISEDLLYCKLLYMF